eukprot:6008062-Pleurochrysis_carterae.AAC.1
MVIKERKGRSSYIKVVLPKDSEAEENDENDADDSDEEDSAPAPSAAQRRHRSQRGSEVTITGGLHVGSLKKPDARAPPAASTTHSGNEASTQAEHAMQQLMWEHARERAEAARELKATQQANSAMLKEMAALR